MLLKFKGKRWKLIKSTPKFFCGELCYINSMEWWESPFLISHSKKELFDVYHLFENGCQKLDYFHRCSACVSLYCW